MPSHFGAKSCNCGQICVAVFDPNQLGEPAPFSGFGVFVFCHGRFTALAYLKAAILEAEGVVFAPFGFAAVKALICAKFLSIGYVFHLRERSFVFLALLIVLTVLEELIVGYLHHRAFADSIAEIGGGTLHQAIATSIILLLILIPFFAFRSLAEVVGARVLFRLFFEPRRKLDVAPAKAHREGA
jgi:hypothetical protein